MAERKGAKHLPNITIYNGTISLSTQMSFYKIKMELRDLCFKEQFTAKIGFVDIQCNYRICKKIRIKF